MRRFGGFDSVNLDAAAQAADQRKGHRQTDYDLSGSVTSARRVMFKPMLGPANQEKLLPLRYCPLQIELELVNSPADAVSLEVVEGFATGSAWVIRTLDSSLDDEYASHLLFGKPLPINFNTWNHTNQSTCNDKTS